MIAAELRLLLRSRLAAASLLLLFLLSALAVAAGLSQMARQRAAIDRAAVAARADLADTMAVQAKPDGEAGYAAYYGFLLTSDPPPPLAFAAIGQRDIQPATLRIRALGLQQQLYDSETQNAALALPGVFDWAFVAVYLMPLVVVALAHDLIAGEREAGRLRLLLSMPARGGALWRRRLGLRYLLVLAALLLPAVAAFGWTAAPVGAAAGMVAVAALYAGFWFGLSLLVASRFRAATTAAAALLGMWIVLTLVLPTLAGAAIARAIPVGKAIELTLAQREAVHHGWDIPKRDTFDRFFVHHPEWRGQEGFEGRFHWKWYYAMHQAADEAVAPQVAAYRAALAARARWTERAGWVLPGVAAQVVLHRLADTDLAAQTGYADSIAAFHARLRHFYYPYLFADRPFTAADAAQLPVHAPRAPGGSWPAAPTLALLLAAAVVLTAGAAGLRRVGGMV